MAAAEGFPTDQDAFIKHDVLPILFLCQDNQAAGESILFLCYYLLHKKYPPEYPPERSTYLLNSLTQVSANYDGGNLHLTRRLHGD